MLDPRPSAQSAVSYKSLLYCYNIEESASNLFANLRRGFDIPMKTTQSEEFAHDEYSSLISKVKELSLHDQIRLLEQIASLVRHRTEDDTCVHSIFEMRGKNKQVWESIDVNKYINDERQSWDG
jgi:uncharacterized protein (DUF488 family)